MLRSSSNKQFKHCPINLLNVDDLVLGSENRASRGGSRSCPRILQTASQVSIAAGQDGKFALNTSRFTFMIDSGTQAALDLLLIAIFAGLELTPDVPPYTCITINRRRQ